MNRQSFNSSVDTPCAGLLGIVAGERVLQACLFAGMLAVGMPSGLAATNEVTPDQVVSAIEDAFGVTPGGRRNHTRGTCALGEFIPARRGFEYSRSELFSPGGPVPVVARFFLGGGNPDVPDTATSPRGMALEFRLRNGELQHMTMLDTPVFGATSPQAFLDMMVAIKTGPATGKPDPDKVKAFRSTHLLRHPCIQVHRSPQEGPAGALAFRPAGWRKQAHG
jgi:catalase